MFLVKIILVLLLVRVLYPFIMVWHSAIFFITTDDRALLVLAMINCFTDIIFVNIPRHHPDSAWVSHDIV